MIASMRPITIDPRRKSRTAMCGRLWRAGMTLACCGLVFVCVPTGQQPHSVELSGMSQLGSSAPIPARDGIRGSTHPQVMKSTRNTPVLVVRLCSGTSQGAMIAACWENGLVLLSPWSPNEEPSGPVELCWVDSARYGDMIDTITQGNGAAYGGDMHPLPDPQVQVGIVTTAKTIEIVRGAGATIAAIRSCLRPESAIMDDTMDALVAALQRKETSSSPSVEPAPVGLAIGMRASGLKNGPWTYIGSDGAPITSGYYRDGARYGIWRRWGVDGYLLEQRDYKEGRSNGACEMYRPQGYLRCRGRYVDDRRVGEWVFYDEVGIEAQRVIYADGSEERK